MSGHALGAGTHDVRIVGRAVECARITDWLSATSDGVTALFLQGEQGIGKTTLWRRAVHEWRRAGGLALVARPAEEESSLALSGLVDLFHDIVDVTALRGEQDPITRGRLALDAVRSACAETPVMIAIDDLQWLDAPSARALRYVLRRLDEDAVAVIATLPVGPGVDPLALARLLPPGRCAVLDIGPLDLPALRQLLGSVLTAVSPRLLRKIAAVSGGNPLFALELARSLDRDTSARPSGMLPLPNSLRAAILERLGGVSELAPVLDAMSALARPSVRDLEELFPDVDVEMALTTAEEHGLVTVAGDLQVRFAHPLIGSVVYDRMSPLARRRVHARLADHVTDRDLRARHVALCTDTPAAPVAEELAAAARRASERGSFGLAAELAGHSLRLTPPDEPDALRDHALARVRHLAAAGEMSRALACADRVIAQLPPGPGRAEALVQRAQLEDTDLEAGEAMLVRALHEAGGDAALRGRVFDQLGWLRGVFRGDLQAGIACAREALAMAGESSDRELQMSVAAGLSIMETQAGSPRPDLMRRAVELEDELGRPPLWAGPRVLMAEQFLWAGNLADARLLMEAAVAHAERRTHERWRPYSLYDLAAVESAAGELARAEELLRQAMEAARDCEDDHVESWIFYRLAIVLTWLGKARRARAAARHRADTAKDRGERTGVARARSVLGLLSLSEGDTTTAATELMATADLLEEMGFRHPGAIPALPDGVEALALHGDLDAARGLLERLERQAAAVDSAWVDAATDRAAGALLLASGDPGAAALLEGAASAFRALGFRPDAARAELLRGRACLRNGRRTTAGEVLHEARSAFLEMGAPLWAARAEEELDRVAPGRTTGELTPTERRVAALVAEGRKNREVAQALFMSIATVEAHLTRMYRKLQIRSRSDLTRLVIDGTVVLHDADPHDQVDPTPRRGR